MGERMGKLCKSKSTFFCSALAGTKWVIRPAVPVQMNCQRSEARISPNVIGIAA